MPRPHKIRRISAAPEFTLFRPVGVSLKKTDVVELRLDELEAMRLANLEGLYQEQGAERMHTSRATFGRILEEARRKVTKALIQGKAIKIGGGNVDFPGEESVLPQDPAAPAASVPPVTPAAQDVPGESAAADATGQPIAPPQT